MRVSGSRQIDDAVSDANGTILAAVSADAILHLWKPDDNCALLASVVLPSIEERATAHRPHITLIPNRNAVAIIYSTRQILLVSLDPFDWLARARRVLGKSDDARPR